MARDAERALKILAHARDALSRAGGAARGGRLKAAWREFARGNEMIGQAIALNRPKDPAVTAAIRDLKRRSEIAGRVVMEETPDRCPR